VEPPIASLAEDPPIASLAEDPPIASLAEDPELKSHGSRPWAARDPTPTLFLDRTRTIEGE
jgi:hypothetical protein